MLNTTIISLNVFSLISISPFYTLHASHQYLKASVYHSHIANSFTNFLFSNTKFHKTILDGNVFSSFLNTPIVFINENNIETPNCIFVSDKTNNYTIGEIIDNQTIVPGNFESIEGIDIGNSRPFFKYTCGNITITNCIFNGCYAKSYHGGSIHIQQECYVIIHNTIFNDSYTGKFYGGAAYIVQDLDPNSINFDEKKLPQLNIEFCCFQYCYGQNLLENPKGLSGVAVFSAAQNTILYYTSSVNCPGFELDENRTTAEGSQFDLQADIANLNHINATGGNSKLCSAIECRHAQEMTFKFQTISYMKGKYAISFYNINSEKLFISNTNMFNIELNDNNNDNDSKNYPGLIYIHPNDDFKNCTIEINYFCFCNNSFGDNNNSRIISRRTYTDKDTVVISPVKIILMNCYYDVEDDLVDTSGDDLDHNFIDCINQTSTYLNNPQLLLGDCRGVVTATKLFATDLFSKSMIFSNSDAFSDSGYFSNSKEFTDSNEFSETEKFSFSKYFSDSTKFSNSNKFSNSKVFSGSFKFSCTNEFSISKLFTDSNEFSFSNFFPSYVGDGGNKSVNGNKKKIGMIVGIVVAVIVVIAVITIVVIWTKRKNQISEEEIETIDDTRAVNNSNPIYDTNAVDDPFKEDFDDN